jgi:hypothetical protein
MSLLIKVEERETVQECLDVVLEKLRSLEGGVDRPEEAA